ncbi:MAG: dehydrogenase E1 component subunit alpha/beta [Deltaproteobacteria bacterium]|nr:dehydrogenase E1 component subunit alpha/beta [Deltaproteobacteria bacterium]
MVEKAVALRAESQGALGKSGPVLNQAERLRLYRLMLTSRRLDDLEIQLKRQNQIFFQISGAGHEATQAAAALLLKPGYDWFFPYYRDKAFCLGIGYSALDMLLGSFGARTDPSSGGRQMPSHWGRPELNLVAQSSPTGTQFLNAVGCAEAGLHWQRLQREGVLGRRFQADEVVYVSSGEGTTSEGEFFEALNTACNLKLPVLFHIEDNGYAISVPVEVQTAGASITPVVAGFPDLLRLEFDGCDPEASVAAWAEGIRYARARRGPVLLHAHVIRPYSHSLSDDHRLYRPQVERAADAGKDPITNYRELLLGKLKIPPRTLTALEAEVDAELAAARDRALAAPPPDPTTAERYVYSPDLDPTSAEFATAALTDGEPETMVDLINVALKDEMRRDARVIVFGEDVADVSREAALSEVQGKGGVFKVTHGLQREFGSARVFNSPLAEANIVGRAVGMAIRGLKPVVEIQFFDYIWPAMMQIRSELAALRWRSDNHFSCPVVIRCTYGGYLKGGGVYHSQTGESIFAHIPGLRVVLPSCALDANGLLRTAIRCDDPVLFLEHKHLYRQAYNRAPYPGPDFMIPFGKAKTVRAGKDMTIVCYGALVKRCLDAANLAATKGVDVEVLDLRTVSPYDWDAIAASVLKTSKVIVAYEDARSWGSGAEIAARIADELFAHLDGPVRRVASRDTFVGYHPVLEDTILPQTDDVSRAIDALASY